MTPSQFSRSARLDAIVVPACRGPFMLAHAIRLSARLDVLLVVLCSQQTRPDEVATLVSRTAGARAVIVDVPVGYTHPILPWWTKDDQFVRASAGRLSDLSLKRNLGLLLGRLQGWTKILFLDDDIRDSNNPAAGIGADSIRRLAAQLDDQQVAGMVCRDFPDNSVVCHARRLAGFDQDNFVSGAALGVNCSDLPLPFFPDIYNEDWFFFSRPAAQRELAHVGEAVQVPYDPYAKAERARQEEFGDLLAEGLYALFEAQPRDMTFSSRLAEADDDYWRSFIEARAVSLEETSDRLATAIECAHEADGLRMLAAVRSLRAAGEQLGQLTPDLCVNFVDAWQGDLAYWESATQRIKGVHGTREAMDHLQLTSWQTIDRRSQSAVA